MPSFEYRAETPSGEIRRGTIDADDRDLALEKLRVQHLNPLSIKRSFADLALRERTQKTNTIVIERFSGRLGQLLSAGLPLADGLALLAKRPTAEGQMAEHALGAIRQGGTLSGALRAQGSNVPDHLLSQIEIGEESGTLATQLQQMASDLLRVRIRSRDLVGQLIYPAILFVLMILTIFFLAHFILPEFEAIFEGARTAPPPETAFVLAAGRAIRDWGWLFPALVLAGSLAGRVVQSRAPERLEQFALRFPFYGQIFRKAEAQRFCQSLSTLLVSGRDLAASLPLASKAFQTAVNRRQLSMATDQVKAGVSLSNALKQLDMMPSTALELIALGESSGRLGAMLGEAAQLLEEENAMQLKRISAFSGPLLTALMGVMTAGVIAAVMSGVMSLNDVLG